VARAMPARTIKWVLKARSHEINLSELNELSDLSGAIMSTMMINTIQTMARMSRINSVIGMIEPKSRKMMKMPAMIAKTDRITIKILEKSPVPKIAVTVLRISPPLFDVNPKIPVAKR
jgi:hypothetical protein